MWCGGQAQIHYRTSTERRRCQKSLVQIKQQGKVKGMSASAEASGLPVEKIETRVALTRPLLC